MSKTAIIVTGAQAALLAGFVLAVRAGAKLGVPGQWEWLRIPAQVAIPWAWMALGILFCAGYALFAALGLRALSRPITRGGESRWLAGLALASLIAQFAATTAAPDEYDHTKWAYVNYFTSSAGYFTIARDQAMADPGRFLADYPRWIERQDSLHIGTHPPGLILAECALVGFMADHPRVADALVGLEPPSTAEGFRQLAGFDRRPILRSERAALFATALATWAACALVVVPLYVLARAALSPRGAWCAAALWPLAPSAILFQPLADTAYPFLATLALALAAWSAKTRGPRAAILALATGAALALGAAFTLAFFPVGLMVALIFLFQNETPTRSRTLGIAATGAGFAIPWILVYLATSANPLTIAVWNLHHHARFYDDYPRGYWRWFWINPLELVLAIGAAGSVWLLRSLRQPLLIPRSSLAAIVVVVLVNLTGRNLGETARLWMLFMPALLPAAGAAMERDRAGAAGLAATIAMVAIQTLFLESTIQVVYPVG